MNFRLRSLPLGARLGIVCLCAVLGIGLAASLRHMYSHYEKRDERAGFTPDDIRGAYHGMRSLAPLRTALERGHPETLGAGERGVLLDWLLGKEDAVTKARPAAGNPRMSSEYDDLDLGELAPSEIMRANCLSCHARSAAATNPIANTFPLDTWDDVRAIAASREVNPTDPKKLAISIHAHALSLGVMAVVVGGMFLCTAWPRGVAGWFVLLSSAGLLIDFAAQMLARAWEPAFWLIIAGGGVYNVLTAVMILGVAVDVVRPSRGEGVRSG